MALGARKSRQLARGLGLLLTVLLLAAQFGKVPLLGTLYQRLELFVYDHRVQAHLVKRVEPDSRIVIVDIDETSLNHLGQWPWPRQLIAELLQRLDESGAVVVGVDVLFAEAERNPVQTLLDELGEEQASLQAQLAALAPQLDGDAVLARQLAGSEVILGYTFDERRSAAVGRLPPPLVLVEPEKVSRLALTPMAGYTAPIERLQHAAASAGFFSLRPDIDGVVRRAPLIARYQNKVYGALSLEIVRRYMFLQQVRLESAPIDGVEEIEYVSLEQAVRVPTDGEGRMLIPFRGGPGSFPYVSAQAVLSGEVGGDVLAGTIVLLGTTAAGLFDLRATPVSPVYPGVEVHANLISAMLDGRYLVVPSWADGANFAFGLLLGVLLALIMPRLTVLWLLLLTGFTTGAVTAVTAWFWSSQGLVLNLAGPLLLIGALAVGNLAWGFFFESQTRHRLKDMFGQYVPPELVDEMSERPEEFGQDGEAREMSVLFSDIRGFTSISESLTADELKRFLNRFFTPMTRIIFQRHGTIDKYVGDMVVAFWGAPVRDEQHAVHAIEAALDMLAEAERLRGVFAASGWPEVKIGIGINSGAMSVGDMGSEYRRTYTVLGDAVNLGSRLEGTTKYYGVGMVVGERTRELAAGAFVFRELDKVQVKGKEQAIRVYQPVCRRDQADPLLLQEVELLEQALAAFRAQQWGAAQADFARLQQLNPTFNLYGLYQERIAELRERSLGTEWNGVYVRKEK